MLSATVELGKRRAVLLFVNWMLIARSSMHRPTAGA